VETSIKENLQEKSQIVANPTKLVCEPCMLEKYEMQD